jgi:diguanylate cyclase (GGDEF)-like protein
VAYRVGCNDRLVGLLLLCAALACHGVCAVGTGLVATDPRQVLVQAVYILAFASASFLFLQVEVSRRKREHHRRLTEEIRAMREEARDFRLISTALTSANERDRGDQEGKLARGAVEAIHQGMFFLLDLLKKSLDLQTCVLLWLDTSGRQLQIKEMVSDSDLVNELPIPAQAGALGGVVKNRLLLNLRTPRGDGIPYYKGPEKIGAFVGVPVLEDGHLRGVLCADRRNEKVFTETEEKLLVEATKQMMRAIQTERVLSAVERAKYEHERFFRASMMLNSALTLAQVYEKAFEAAREIVDFDFGAITLYDPTTKKHTICKVIGTGHETFEGAVFADNAGLVSLVVKNKHFLPAHSMPRERDAMVFRKGLRLKGMQTLLVIPLIAQDQALGTLVFACHREGRLPKRVREMLTVISNQVAISVENAQMYKRMEEMATTDGMTGLPNHRTFQARFSEMLYRADRHGKPVSIVLTDVDKFKGINDTHGHPVGDMVLRRVARVLAEQVRKVDIVARYGGEEFVMVLEETDERGAMQFAERVREQLAAQLMSSEQGSFRVTISLGVASYPTDGSRKEELIERADQALYQAKATGRNRSVAYGSMKRAHSAVG